VLTHFIAAKGMNFPYDAQPLFQLELQQLSIKGYSNPKSHERFSCRAFALRARCPHFNFLQFK
jgi:hypothetical protein